MQQSQFQFWPPWKPLAALERRFSKARPGSVLILVVALLVLLALLGTAFINTSRTDRASAAQNSFNTEVELLLQGLVDLTKASAVNGLFGTSPKYIFHQTATTQPISHYAISDYPTNTESSFIADRYPTVSNLTTTASTSNLPLWLFISTLNNPVHFDSPYINASATPYPTPTINGYTIRSQMSPTSVSWTNTSGQTVTCPALGFYDTTQTTPPYYYVALAADADGDGIADSALFRLPVGEINGVTYYGGVRVIDNAAAVNAAIAWQAADPTTVSSGIPGNFYPTAVDLNGLLVTGDTLTNLNTWRFDNQASPSLTPVDDRETPPAGGPPPVADTPASRSDFSFGNTYEAFWMQLGRRIANPGYITAATGGQYQALSLDESQVLAHDFILRSPWVTSPSQSTSEIEQNLSYSTFGNPPTSAATLYRSAPYAANQAVNWYNTNFDFVTGNMPIRSMLVTQNGVSNFTLSKLLSRGNFLSTNSYNYADWVFNPSSAGGDDRAYVCMHATPGTAPDPTTPSGAGWERMPWVSGPTKVSANTATFGQLWMGYFSAMSIAIPTASGFAINPNIVPVAAAGGNDQPSNAMFRSAIRTGGPAAWSPAQQLRLRAAIAAINTVNLRGIADDVTSRDIQMDGQDGSTVFKATVYGTTKQPYITEVYATNEDTPYVAIELYNPFSVPITLTNWQLAYTPRSAGGNLAFTPVTGTTSNWGGSPPTVPAQGFLVLANVNPPPSGMALGTTNIKVVTGLENARNSELYILKPRAFNGTLASSSTPTNTFNESTPSDLVPVDSYDFTGLDPAAPPPHVYWHYIRPNDPNAGKAWHWVYPGPYNSSLGTDATHPRLTATQVGDPATITALPSMGAADATSLPPSSGTYIDRPLQIANQDFGGPKTATGYPYGGFARNADLLQVTYIGPCRIEDSSGHILELNPVTMDSTTANDPNLDNDTTSEQYGRQNIGRFTPIHWQDTVTASATAGAPPMPTYTTEFAAYTASHPPLPSPQTYFPDDYWATDGTMQTAYHWTFDLFDYVTVQAPHDDYLPDVDPLKYVPGTNGGPGATPVANSSYLVANAGYTANTAVTPPTLGQTSTNYLPSATEETAPVHGRININTANWRVLATLPMFDGAVYGASPNTLAQANTQLAQSIVYYRDVDDGSTGGVAPLHPHGAFQSIDELNNVPITGTGPIPTNMGYTFRNVFGKYVASQVAGMTMAQTPPSPFVVPAQHGSNADGDISPFNAAALMTPGGDLVYGDFENQNLALNRISNLITTRSDSFTAYVIVQGWRNAGTNNPTLVVQRRAAFILDRSPVTPSSKTPATTNIPSY